VILKKTTPIYNRRGQMMIS